MSQSTSTTDDELLEMMQGEPADVLKEHADLLEEMQAETDSELLAEYIAALLDTFEEGTRWRRC